MSETNEPTTLTLDGVEYHLAYDFNAIADAEEPAGCNLLAALSDLADLTARQLRGLLYAAIVEPYPGKEKPTLEQVGKMIHPRVLGEITSALGEAYFPGVMEAMAAAKVAEALKLAPSPEIAG